MAEIEIYLKNIRKRWQDEVAAADEVLIFSPYVTNSTAQAVCKGDYADKCRVYTGFTYPLFLYGSSDTRALLALKKSGARIFKLPKLHAKMVIVPGVFASVGSQNLTLQGTKNLEGTLAATDENTVGKIERQARKWAENATELSEEEIQDMEDLVAPFRKKLKQLMKEAGGIDDEVERLEEEREAERKRLSEEAAERMREAIEAEQKKKETDEAEKDRLRREQEERARRVKAALRRQANAKEIVRGEVKCVNKESNLYSMVPYHSGSRFDRWVFDGELVRLDRLTRYLCILEDTGKLCWVRVAKGRMTYYGKSINWTKPQVLNGIQGKISFDAVWPPDLEKHVNLKVTFKIPKQGRVFVDCWFGVDEVIVQTVKYQPLGDGEHAKSMGGWIRNQSGKFQDEVLPILLRPFVYKHGLHGYGVRRVIRNAEDDLIKWPFVRVVLVSEKPLVVISSTNRKH